MIDKPQSLVFADIKKYLDEINHLN